MSKKRKKCKHWQLSAGFTAGVFVVVLTVVVTASLIHLDAVERIEAAERRLEEIETMQKHIRQYLATGMPTGRME